MPADLRLWLRHEVRDTEHRTPVVPSDAARLVAAGVAVTVEDSPRRVFATDEYTAVGCAVAEAGSWVDAPAGTYVVGLKDLPAQPVELRHRHVFFSHTFKGQEGSRELLRRFATGGGAILDLEYLTDDNGRRLAAFGYWAGYIGAALAVLHRRGDLGALTPASRDDLDRRLARDRDDTAALVIGALGRCGTGASDALAVAGVEPTKWDLAETRELDRDLLLRHEILVNAVLSQQPAPPFVGPDDLTAPGRRLTVISDVTCDVGSPNHLLPVYDHTTTWATPVLRVPDTSPPLDVISIDNLPSLLPREASIAFSADLTPHLLSLADNDSPWQRCLDRYRRAVAGLGNETEATHA